MEVEDIELIFHEEDGTRLVIGSVKAARLPNGKLTAHMRMHPKYGHMRGFFRNHIESYLGAIPWYRQRSFGDHIA